GRVALHPWIYRHHNLRGIALLQFHQCIVQPPFRLGGRHPGKIIEMPRRLGRDGLRGHHPTHRPEQQDRTNNPHHSPADNVRLHQCPELVWLKSKFTSGGRSAPAVASKYGRSSKPRKLATMFAGTCLIFVLYACTALLKSIRATAIRFSVPSSCACKS